MDHACSAYSYISVPLYDTLGVCLVAQAESLQVCPSPSNFFFLFYAQVQTLLSML